MRWDSTRPTGDWAVPLSTDEIAKTIGRSVPRIGNILGHLEAGRDGRYETSRDRVFRKR